VKGQDRSSGLLVGSSRGERDGLGAAKSSARLICSIGYLRRRRCWPSPISLAR
jgi:hypothetical protein